jgi:hypothetical protein
MKPLLHGLLFLHFFFCLCLFVVSFLFDIFFQGTSKLNSRTKMLLMTNLPHTFSEEGRGKMVKKILSLSLKYGLLEQK